MRKNLLKLTFLILVTVSLFSLSQKVLAKDNFICATYFTGVGCSHCANTDPLILRQLQKEYPDLVIIEYEIYQQRENAPLLEKYNSEYHSGLGIPLIIFGKEKYAAGDVPILQKTEKTIKELGQNSCPLLETSTDFENLDLLSLPGKPKIWKNDRILIRTEEEKWIFQWNGESSTKKGEIKPDKNIIRVNNSIFGRYANRYPKTIAKAVNVPISAIRKVFLSNQTELLIFSVSIFSALLSIAI